MRRFIFQLNHLTYKVISLILTFSIGAGSTLVFRVENSDVKVIENSPPNISLCQLAQNPENYDGKIIRVEADIDDFDGEPFISDKTCNQPEVIVGVGFAQEYELVSAKL